MVFPEYGVHFIAVNDGVDSMKGDSEFTAIRNIFNANLSQRMTSPQDIASLLPPTKLFCAEYHIIGSGYRK